ncbi:MAG: 40S ribosomal protein S19 [Nanoarchaeota archaeon]
MATIFETNTNALIDKTAGELKKLIKAPEYSMYVKTGAGKERPPTDKEWYYKRAASILRSIYLRGAVGVNKLKIKYANKKNKGMEGERVYKASGKIIRNILQQLEKAELIKQVQKGTHKGRILTNKGKGFLDKLSK